MMKTTNRFSKFWFPLTCVFLVAYVIGVVVIKYKNIETVKLNKSERFLTTDKYYNETLFLKGESEKDNDWQINDSVTGAIIPHHGLAAKYFSSFFNVISGKNIKTIILIGPNHKLVGDNPVYTSDLTWETEFGQVNADYELVQKLTETGKVGIDDKIIEDEHSVATIMPYIAKYMPGVKVVPLVCKEINLNKIGELTEIITANLEPGVIVISAVDFSHYLLAQEAVEMDKETISVIETHNYEKLLSFGNEHLDSPTSIILLDKIMRSVGADKFNILINSNSFEITGKSNQATSYLFGVYSR